jgi:hypothetical protein
LLLPGLDVLEFDGVLARRTCFGGSAADSSLGSETDTHLIRKTIPILGRRHNLVRGGNEKQFKGWKWDG